MPPEQPGEFDGFINDEGSEPLELEIASSPELPDDIVSLNEGYRYVPDRCPTISFDEYGNEVVCGNLKNPAEQLCQDCRVFGHRITGLM